MDCLVLSEVFFTLNMTISRDFHFSTKGSSCFCLFVFLGISMRFAEVTRYGLKTPPARGYLFVRIEYV